MPKLTHKRRRVSQTKKTESSLVVMTDWLEQKARRAERQKSYGQAIVVWSYLLDRVRSERNVKMVDVTRLASIHFRLAMAHRMLNEPVESLEHLKISVRLNSSARYLRAYREALDLMPRKVRPRTRGIVRKPQTDKDVVS